MSRGINKVIILGRLGQDPSYMKSAFGNAVSKISVATSEYWKDKNTGEDREATEWHKIVFFGKLADVVNQHLKKGSQVYIEGSLKTNKYTDKNGIERYSTEIHANELQIITWPNDNQQQAPAQSRAPARQPQPKPENQPLSREEAERIFSEGENDDIPF